MQMFGIDIDVRIPTVAALPVVGQSAKSNDGHLVLVESVKAAADFHVCAGKVLAPAAHDMEFGRKTQTCWMLRLAEETPA
jgi:hypothetical protein